mmetsp:Transcript_21798/g.44182  ORF Transcript_21798/g.44182 Transcript_21798/m.44182 type:complete len:274 (+) Transcript_21798:1478-2299(+)
MTQAATSSSSGGGVSSCTNSPMTDASSTLSFATASLTAGSSPGKPPCALSMSYTHLHRPLRALETRSITSGWKSAEQVYFRIASRFAAGTVAVSSATHLSNKPPDARVLEALLQSSASPSTAHAAWMTACPFEEMFRIALRAWKSANLKSSVSLSVFLFLALRGGAAAGLGVAAGAPLFPRTRSAGEGVTEGRPVARVAEGGVVVDGVERRAGAVVGRGVTLEARGVATERRLGVPAPSTSSNLAVKAMICLSFSAKAASSFATRSSSERLVL